MARRRRLKRFGDGLDNPEFTESRYNFVEKFADAGEKHLDKGEKFVDSIDRKLKRG